MDVLVTYDVATDTPEGRKRLRHVARVCVDYGQRVQKSVFECSVSEVQYEKMKQRLLKRIDEDEDSLRLYRLQAPKERFIEQFGIDRGIDFHGPLVA